MNLKNSFFSFLIALLLNMLFPHIAQAQNEIETISYDPFPIINEGLIPKPAFESNSSLIREDNLQIVVIEAGQIKRFRDRNTGIKFSLPDLSKIDANCNSLAKELQNFIDQSCEDQASCVFNTSGKLKEKVSEFDSSCSTDLKPFQTLTNSTIGIFSSNNKLLCLGWKSANTMITAKHCFLAGNAINESFERQHRTITFHIAPLSQLDKKITIKALLPSEVKNDTDVIVFKANGEPDVVVEKVDLNKEIDAVVVNQYLNNDNINYKDNVRIYKKPVCKFIADNNRCLVHTCPTLTTFSGAPLYQKKENHFTLVAIHSGYDPSAINGCDQIKSTSAFNLASPLSLITEHYYAKNVIFIEN